MTFKSDIERIVREWLDQQAIRYDPGIDTETLVTRYLEMLNRRIEPKPREVHFSDEIHDSLGRLLKETRPEQKHKAVAAWETVFFSTTCLVKGTTSTDSRAGEFNSWRRETACCGIGGYSIYI